MKFDLYFNVIRLVKIVYCPFHYNLYNVYIKSISNEMCN